MATTVFNPNATGYIRDIIGTNGIGVKRPRPDTVVLSIGQSVQPSANPTFSSVTTTGKIHAGTVFQMGTSSTAGRNVIASDTNGNFAFSTAASIESIIAGSSTSVSNTGSTYAVSVATSGVSSGTYNHANVTLNDRGLVTAATSNTSVESLAGTANQIVASASTGAVTLSLANTTVTPGPYEFPTIIVDQQGRLSGATTNSLVRTLVAGAGINVANVGNDYAVALASLGAGGTFTNPSITTDIYGRVTAATSTTVVSSVTGTANQVIASASTGALTLSTPQSIGTSSAVQFGTVGVGGTAGTTVDVTGASTTSFGQVGSIRLKTANPGTGGQPRLVFGITNAANTMSSSYIQSVENGVSYRPLLLNNTSGNVGIGDSFTPGSQLSVKGNVAFGSTYCSLAAPSNGALFEGNVSIGKSSNSQPLDVVGNMATTTGLYVGTSGGTPSLFDFFETTSLSATFGGPIPDFTPTIKLQRDGNHAIMTMTGNSGAATGTTTVLTSATALPTRYRPFADQCMLIQTNMNGVTYAAPAFVRTNGIIEIYGQAYSMTPWPAVGASNGYLAFTMSWLIA